MVQQLLGRVVPRLRALVLLPTRGLAVQVHHVFSAEPKPKPKPKPQTPNLNPTQVHKVFAALCKPTPLRVGLAVGQEGLPFELERALLLGPCATQASNPRLAGWVPGRSCSATHTCKPRLGQAPSAGAACAAGGPLGGGHPCGDAGTPGGATAGRRHAHAALPNPTRRPTRRPGLAVSIAPAGPSRRPGQPTPYTRAGGFTLQHLRWLVVDEADRLLQPGYHGWLQQVLLALGLGVADPDPDPNPNPNA